MQELFVVKTDVLNGSHQKSLQELFVFKIIVLSGYNQKSLPTKKPVTKALACLTEIDKVTSP